MTAVQHVFKRGSVYWWRRRLPVGTGRHDWVRLEVSLETKELDRARRIAPEVTLASHRLQSDLKTKMIPADVARQILIQVAREKSDWLDAVKSGSARNAESNRRSETAAGWAYRLLAAQGRDAVVGPTEERDLRNAGLDDDLIKMTKSVLKFYQENNFARVGKKYLEGLLEQYGIRPSPLDLGYAESLYLRGHAAALLNTQRRWSGVREDDLAIIQEAFATAPVASAPAPSPHTPRPVRVQEQSRRQSGVNHVIHEGAERVGHLLAVNGVGMVRRVGDGGVLRRHNQISCSIDQDRCSARPMRTRVRRCGNEFHIRAGEHDPEGASVSDQNGSPQQPPEVFNRRRKRTCFRW
ncbi:hypothetical protein [Rhizobium sp. 18065]|uniref:hypothetical protein n=1 Tax=Rhizobium sp. 18065 TaxID=2681411 RepID=UPI001357264E|nr:hypothetical protein [Rhizobium sp. 18065]